jgi:hypothetical protein
VLGKRKAPAKPKKQASRVQNTPIPRANDSLRQYKVFESPENFFQKVFGQGSGQRPENPARNPTTIKIYFRKDLLYENYL